MTLSTEHFIFSKDTKEPLAIPPQHLHQPRNTQTNKIHTKHHSTTMRPLLLKLSVVKILSNATQHEKNTTLSETQNFQGKSAPPPHKAHIFITNKLRTVQHPLNWTPLNHLLLFFLINSLKSLFNFPNTQNDVQKDVKMNPTNVYSISRIQNNKTWIKDYPFLFSSHNFPGNQTKQFLTQNSLSTYQST